MYTTIYIFGGPPAMSKTRPPTTMHRTGTEGHGMSDVDAISYLNRTDVPGNGDKSIRNQLLVC